MKQFFKLITIFVASLYILSCSAGGGGTPVTAVVIPDASTVVSVKTLQVDSEHVLCGSGFSSVLSDNKMSLKVSFQNDKNFNVAFTFYDSSCAASGTVGNVIATYNFSGKYAVPSSEGNVIMTVASSTMTILAGDFPTATKKMIDWMNSCSNMEDNFSYSQNKTISLSLGPKCEANLKRAFSFTAQGSSMESTQDSIYQLVKSE